jgi:predicted nucleic acid-binding protein
VLVSAMLTAGGAPDLTIQLILQGDAILLADSRILGEYDDVTSRARFGFDPRKRFRVLAQLASISEHVQSRPLRLALPDDEDRVFVEVAVAGRADAIVTGNTRHYLPTDGTTLGLPVLTPRQFTEGMRQ